MYDPDPTDTTCDNTFVYLTGRGGRLNIETDHYLYGFFDLQVWLGLLKDVGFKVKQMEFRHSGVEEKSYPMFLCIKL